jgi:hypothetical protein
VADGALRHERLDRALEEFSIGRKYIPGDLQLAHAYAHAASLRHHDAWRVTQTQEDESLMAQP